LLVVVTMLWHVREWFEIEDSDSKPLAVKRAGDDPAPNLMWLESGDRDVGAHLLLPRWAFR
jgi:hypothetical protein